MFAVSALEALAEKPERCEQPEAWKGDNGEAS